MIQLTLDVIRLRDIDGYQDFALTRNQIKFTCLALCNFCDSFILVSTLTKENNEFIINGKIHLDDHSFIYLMPSVVVENIQTQDNGILIPVPQEDITDIFIDNCVKKDDFWVATPNEKNLASVFARNVDADQNIIKTPVRYHYVWIFNWPEIITNVANFFGFVSMSSCLLFALRLHTVAMV